MRVLPACVSPATPSSHGHPLHTSCPLRPRPHPTPSPAVHLLETLSPYSSQGRGSNLPKCPCCRRVHPRHGACPRTGGPVKGVLAPWATLSSCKCPGMDQSQHPEGLFAFYSPTSLHLVSLPFFFGLSFPIWKKYMKGLDEITTGVLSN